MATPLEQEAIREIMKPLRSPCVIELGAHTGEDEVWIREACSEEAHYVMVEPDMRNAQYILDKGLHQTRRLILGAVSDKNGVATFHASVGDGGVRGSGSIREPYKHLEAIPSIKFPEEMRTVVPTYTLDEIYRREWLSHIDLLWVDIQGAERNMIAGGEYALNRTRYLFIETEMEEFYHGQATKPELFALLPNWTVIQDFGENALLKNTRYNYT